jgi:hypothetical protein
MASKRRSGWGNRRLSLRDELGLLGDGGMGVEVRMKGLVWKGKF